MSTPCFSASAATASTSLASICSATKRGSLERGDEVGGALAVVVRHDHLLEPLTLGVATLGDRGDRLADTTGADDQSLHDVPSP